MKTSDPVLPLVKTRSAFESSLKRYMDAVTALVAVTEAGLSAGAISGAIETPLRERLAVVKSAWIGE